METGYTRSSIPRIVRLAGSGGGARVNREFTERLGLTGAELEAHPLLEWIHPNDRQALEQAMGAKEGCTSARHRAKDGEWISLFQSRNEPEGFLSSNRGKSP